MLRPSYSELMDIVNKAAGSDDMITSRYSIVIATAKRARQIIDGAIYDAEGISADKAVSIAINELQRGKIKIYPEGQTEDRGQRAESRGQALNLGLTLDMSLDGGGLSSKDYADDFDVDAEELGGAAIEKDFGFDDKPFNEEREIDDGYEDDFDYSGDLHNSLNEDMGEEDFG